VFFPRSSTNKWRFSWKVMEIGVARPTEVLGHCVTTTDYSGDTEWWTRSSPPAPISL